MIDATFAHRLRVIRQRRDFSQSDLARAAGLEPSAIAHMEAGRRLPSYQTMRGLVLALDVSADFLLGIIKETRRP